MSPSILVPCLTHDGIKVWDTLAIAEYLHEIKPKAGLFPADRAARAHCRAICGDMHSGFSSLRSALPMTLKAKFPGHKVWARAEADIERITTIWCECQKQYGGPFLFGKRCAADAMYAPVVTRFITYDVKLDKGSYAYCDHIMALPEMTAWIKGRKPKKRKSTSSTPSSEPGGGTSGRYGGTRGRHGGAAAAFRPKLPSATPAYFQGVGGGISAGPLAMSTVLKSAGPTTSRYSMSGE